MNISTGFKRIVALVILLAGAHIQTAQALPILQLDSSNQLLGATGVLIDGLSYDVQFIPSSCDLIWSGCDPDKFLFKTLESATTASQALLDQVFLDLGPNLLFDSVPGTLNGGGISQILSICIHMDAVFNKSQRPLRRQRQRISYAC